MSGGYFDYKQYHLEYIIDAIQELIDKNNTPDEWGEARDYRPTTLEAFDLAIFYLKLAKRYTHRIDWLVSGDDGEETFHKRLGEDLYDLLPR